MGRPATKPYSHMKKPGKLRESLRKAAEFARMYPKTKGTQHA